MFLYDYKIELMKLSQAILDMFLYDSKMYQSQAKHIHMLQGKHTQTRPRDISVSSWYQNVYIQIYFLKFFLK